MPSSELGVLELTWCSFVFYSFGVVYELRRTREATVDEAREKMTPKDGSHLRPPIQVVVRAELGGDERREVERRW
jgi:hypothetical protein